MPLSAGTYIRQKIYLNRGVSVWRYGFIINIVGKYPTRAKVVWFPNKEQYAKKIPYIEIIKLELIEILSEA